MPFPNPPRWGGGSVNKKKDKSDGSDKSDNGELKQNFKLNYTYNPN